MLMLTNSYTFYRANEHSRSRHSYSLMSCICTFICLPNWLCRFKSAEQQILFGQSMQCNAYNVSTYACVLYFTFNK